MKKPGAGPGFEAIGALMAPFAWASVPVKSRWIDPSPVSVTVTRTWYVLSGSMPSESTVNDPR